MGAEEEEEEEEDPLPPEPIDAASLSRKSRMYPTTINRRKLKEQRIHRAAGNKIGGPKIKVSKQERKKERKKERMNE